MLKPSSVIEPDRTTYYCDVQSKKLRVGCCKVLDYYVNGDARVLTQNGVQFTARAEEIFNLRVGDYHDPLAI